MTAGYAAAPGFGFPEPDVEIIAVRVCVWQVDDPGIKRALMDGFPGVLETPDQHGRKILILFASNWDQSR